MKLGICIPYRDSGDGVRQGHLDRLIPHLEEFLGKQGIDFTCYVGHQIDNEKFHRSGTKNIAYLQAKKDGCDYFAFHDVDMLPYDDCHYGHPGDSPKHIATWLSQWGYTLRDTEYFGGVVIFTAEQFERINGYNTEYVGWGMEDDDLFWRCVLEGYADDSYMKYTNKEQKYFIFRGDARELISVRSEEKWNFFPSWTGSSFFRPTSTYWELAATADMRNPPNKIEIATEQELMSILFE